jgi:hypothetical protein
LHEPLRVLKKTHGLDDRDRWPLHNSNYTRIAYARQDSVIPRSG